MTYLAIIELFFTGAFSGFLAGFIGIGGGVVLTPLCLMLYPSLGIENDSLVKVIFGTNMFLVLVYSLSAVIKHHSNNNIEWRTVLIMGPLAVLGAFIGSWFASIANPLYLKKVLAIFIIFSSLLIIIKGSTKPGKSKSSRISIIPGKYLPLLGLLAGTIGSLLGIGGGIIMIAPLILLFNLPIKKVAGTSSSVIVFIGLAGALGYMYHGHGIVDLPGWSSGYVWWSAAIPLLFGGVPMAQAGAWLNFKINSKLLRRIFGIILFVLALKILF